MAEGKSRLVYSTDMPVSRKETTAHDDRPGIPPPAEQKVIVRLERKGRGGKSVTVIDGLRMGQKERESLLRLLKSRLGSGGTLGQSVVEIQGDHRDAVIEALQQRGFRPKRSG